MIVLNSDDYFMCLSRALNQNSKKIFKLLERFETPKNVFEAERSELLDVKGISEKNADSIILSKNNADMWLYELDKENVRFVSINNSQYPSLLRKIENPPVGLYVKGNLPKAEDRLVSIIGSRRCSEYGRLVAERISSELAQNGVWVVSGMARGIDSAPNWAAVKNGGKTAAVLGFGHANCYPAENRGLMREIGEKGCLISEYPPYSSAETYHFPRRNRIIAAVSEITVIVEASKKSGTIITANYAIDYGRTVMAVPSNITSSTGTGTNELIKNGCAVVMNADDIFFELGIKKTKEKPERKHTEEESVLSAEEQKVLNFIGMEPVRLEYILNKTGFPVQKLQALLLMLEIRGFIQKLPGDRFIIK